MRLRLGPPESFLLEPWEETPLSSSCLSRRRCMSLVVYLSWHMCTRASFLAEERLCSMRLRRSHRRAPDRAAASRSVRIWSGDLLDLQRQAALTSAAPKLPLRCSSARASGRAASASPVGSRAPGRPHSDPRFSRRILRRLAFSRTAVFARRHAAVRSLRPLRLSSARWCGLRLSSARGRCASSHCLIGMARLCSLSGLCDERYGCWSGLV